MWIDYKAIVKQAVIWKPVPPAHFRKAALTNILRNNEELRDDIDEFLKYVKYNIEISLKYAREQFPTVLDLAGKPAENEELQFIDVMGGIPSARPGQQGQQQPQQQQGMYMVL